MWGQSSLHLCNGMYMYVCRHEVERSRSPKLKRERDEAKHEVQSLPEVVIGAPSSSEDSGVVTRLRETRKER